MARRDDFTPSAALGGEGVDRRPSMDNVALKTARRESVAALPTGLHHRSEPRCGHTLSRAAKPPITSTTREVARGARQWKRPQSPVPNAPWLGATTSLPPPPWGGEG